MVLGRVKKSYKGLEVGGSIYIGGREGRMVYTSGQVNQPLGIDQVNTKEEVKITLLIKSPK